MNARVTRFIEYLMERLKEPSSIRGLVWVATGGFMQLSVDNAVSLENAASLGMLVAGLLGILLPDKK